MDSSPSHITDIDGDGFPSTANDKQVLADYLNLIRSYLPGHWNKFQSRQEREDWAKKIINIYKVNHRNWDNNSDPLLKYVSGNYRTDICIGTFGHTLEGLDYFGDPKVPIFDKYSNKENNGKGNIPVFGVQRVRNYAGHGMNAILVGDDPLEFNDWLFYEPQLNEFVDIRWDKNSGEFVTTEVYLQLFHNFYYVGQGGQNETQMRGFPSPVVFDTEQGTGSVTVRWVDPMTILTRPTVDIEDVGISNAPISFKLNQNHPNPFNPSTTIHYTLPKESDVHLQIYNMLGQQINQLISSTQSSGTHSIQWNGKDQQGNQVPAGIYFYQLQAGDFVQTKKMVLMK